MGDRIGVIRPAVEVVLHNVKGQLVRPDKLALPSLKGLEWAEPLVWYDRIGEIGVLDSLIMATQLIDSLLNRPAFAVGLVGTLRLDHATSS